MIHLVEKTNIEQPCFKNNFGNINLQFVFINQTNEEFKFKTIAYIELKKQKNILSKNNYFLKIIFTNATSKDFAIKSRQLLYAKEFESFFSNLRNLNTEIE